MSFRLFIDNLEHNISIKYPTTWEKKIAELDTIVAFLSPIEHKLDLFRENLTIMIKNIFISPENFKEYINFQVDQLKDAILDFELIKKKKDKLSNQPAYTIIYTGRRRDFNIKIMQNYILKKKKIYLLIYTAENDKYDQYFKMIKKMIKSFCFL